MMERLFFFFFLPFSIPHHHHHQGSTSVYKHDKGATTLIIYYWLHFVRTDFVSKLLFLTALCHVVCIHDCLWRKKSPPNATNDWKVEKQEYRDVMQQQQLMVRGSSGQWSLQLPLLSVCLLSSLKGGIEGGRSRTHLDFISHTATTAADRRKKKKEDDEERRRGRTKRMRNRWRWRC